MISAFGDEVALINRQIDTYNLTVPASWMAVHRLAVPTELQRALHEAPQRATELRRSRSARLARTSSPTSSRAGGEASITLHEGPTFPSLWDSLSSALFARS